MTVLIGMIHSVYLYLADSGLPILGHYFSPGEVELDSSLTTGMLEALRTFITNLINVESEVESISLKDYQIIYLIGGGLAVVALVDEYTEQEVVRNGLERVLNQLHEKFPDMGASHKLGFIHNLEKEEYILEVLKTILQEGTLGHVSSVPKLIKKIPKAAVSLGMISSTDLTIAELCDGERTLKEIAKHAEKPEADVKYVIEKLIADRICEMVEVKK